MPPDENHLDSIALNTGTHLFFIYLLYRENLDLSNKMDLLVDY